MGVDLQDRASGVRGGRARRALRGGVSSLSARALNLGASLITLPVVIEALGEETVGVHLTIVTMISLFGFIDLGISHGLVSTTAEAKSDGRYTEIRRSVTTAIVANLAIAVAGIAAATILIIPHDWSVFLGAGQAARHQSVNLSLWIVVVVMLVNVPASLAAAVRLGLQESTATNMWLLAAGVMQVAAVYLVASSFATLPWFALATTLPLLICNVGNSISLFLGGRTWLRPSLSLVSKSTLRELLRRGSLFVVLSLAGSLAFQTDALVIARVLGAAEVTEYAVPFRLFASVPMVIALMTYPLWPAYADALACDDEGWVHRIFNRTLICALISSGAVGALLVIFIQPLLDLWVGVGVVRPTPLLLAGLFGYAVVQGVSAPVAMYLNGANIIGFQVAAATVMAGLNLPLSIFLARTVGVAGPVIATVVAQTLCVLLPFVVFVWRRTLRSPGLSGPTGTFAWFGVTKEGIRDARGRLRRPDWLRPPPWRGQHPEQDLGCDTSP